MADKHVYAITKNAEGKSFWTRIGVGFENRDGSINLRLNLVPTNFAEVTLQVRNPQRAEEQDS